MKVISMDRRKDRFVRVGSVSKLLIKFVKPKFRQDSNLDSYGQYDHKTETIEVQDDLSDEQTGQTILHEILHVLTRQNQLNGEGQPLSKDNDEERVVAQFEQSIYAFFVNNPQELYTIFYEIFKDNLPLFKKLISKIK